MLKDLKEVYSSFNSLENEEITLQGWVRNHRKQKEIGFIDFNDGTSFKGAQLVYDNSLADFDDIQKLHIGSAITVTGKLVKSLKSINPISFCLR